MSVSSREFLLELETVAQFRARCGTVGAGLLGARKLRRRRGREPSEEAARQPRAVVDHDALAGLAGWIQNHSKCLTQAPGKAATKKRRLFGLRFPGNRWEAAVTR